MINVVIVHGLHLCSECSRLEAFVEKAEEAAELVQLSGTIRALYLDETLFMTQTS